MEAKLKEEINGYIANNDIVVFSKSYCPYCNQAKTFLNGQGVEDKVFVVELDRLDDGSAIQRYLLELTKQRTVPNIFISQQHIGGCSDLLGLDKAKLTVLLDKIKGKI
ncbi:hypothetical protein BGZ65_002322 [Modicella reniformis]|uniref:Glutaredoxin domain-containing protein n=1 Tax=Modicella reniformis TaxID=1440133 RepID=A0A9P6MBK4_9FUNG|nr:hypothetical protein BGZ65_002322 [Modicella reniformis]